MDRTDDPVGVERTLTVEEQETHLLQVPHKEITEVQMRVRDQ